MNINGNARCVKEKINVIRISVRFVSNQDKIMMKKTNKKKEMNSKSHLQENRNEERF